MLLLRQVVTRRAIDQVEIGFHTCFGKTITEDMILKFAELSGDCSPLHLDESIAKRTIFGERIAHGILMLGPVSAALAQLPGIVVYLSQNVRFLRPVKIGDTIEAHVEVTDKTPEKSEAGLKTYCHNQRGEVVLTGEARVKLLDLR